MKYKVTIFAGALALALLSMIFLQRPAAAEIIDGTVAALDMEKQNFNLQALNAAAKKKGIENIHATVTTRYEGAKSFSDLKLGDQVEVDVTKKAVTEVWEASKIKKKASTTMRVNAVAMPKNNASPNS